MTTLYRPLRDQPRKGRRALRRSHRAGDGDRPTNGSAPACCSSPGGGAISCAVHLHAPRGDGGGRGAAASRPPPGPTMTSLDDLAGLYEEPGPFVTVYLDTTSGVENAGGLLALRWKSARRRLARAGADEATLAAVAHEADAGHTPGDTRAVIAAGGSVLHVSNRPEPPVKKLARWAARPVLGPLIASRQSRVPHVVVLTDRTGGDIVAYPSDDETFAVYVAGAESHITKSAPGGWSQSPPAARREHVAGQRRSGRRDLERRRR